MKTIICALFIFGAFGAFSQQQRELQQKYDQLQTSYKALNDSLSSARTETELLVRELEKNRQSADSTLSVLREENEKLRQIMRNYILQIDQLNTTSLELEKALEDCKQRR